MGKPELKVVKLHTPYRKQDADLDSRQKHMLEQMRIVEDQIRQGAIRSLVIVKRHKKNWGDNCQARISHHTRDDLIIMSKFLDAHVTDAINDETNYTDTSPSPYDEGA